jgi:predicted dehydrogenase
MSGGRLRTVLIGLGKIGAGYADDPVMARFYEFATHAQVLLRHPKFDWDACVDSAPEARLAATDRWGVRHVAASVEELPDGYVPDVVVVATPPGARGRVVDAFPMARAFLLEKPLAISAAEGRMLVERCRDQGALVQVCLWRRADLGLRALAAGELARQIGSIQCLNVIYGNGLRNNGTHMIDLVRMLAGEVTEVRALQKVPCPAGPILGDLNVVFSLQLADGTPAVFLPVDFRHYRENGLEAWGRTGRISILQEGLVARVYQRKMNRAMQDEREIDSDNPTEWRTEPGHALYDLYSNLADGLNAGEELWSPGESALRGEAVVDAVFSSLAQGGARVQVA